MRAAVARQYGPPEVLAVEELPDLKAGPGTVLVGVRAAAVNFPDVLILADRYQVSAPLPIIPGSELAGEVLAVGERVTGFQPGDLVYGSSMSGAFAEQAVLPAAALSPVPAGVSLPEAAAFGVVYRTAYHALRTVAAVRPGDWVVVLGAAGGVGLAAVDLARQLGARVVAAASGREKLELCRARGAEHVIDYNTEDLRGLIKEYTGGGAHAVIDPVGGHYSEPALRATRWGGVFVTLGFAAGKIPAIPLNLVLLKGVIVRGMEIRTFPEHLPEEARRDAAELQAMFADGRVRPHIGAAYPLDRAADALRLVAARRALGKTVITVAG